MTLQISSIVTLASTCDEITLLDSTGTYDVTLNPTGWGAPNPTTANITAATLTTEADAIAVPLVYDFFANIADYLSGGLDISIEDILGSVIAPDGLYTFTITLTVSGVEYTYASTQAFFCVGKCCLLKKFSSLTFPLCVGDKNFSDLNEMYLYFSGMYWSSCCGNTERFTSLLNAFNELCNPCGTSTTSSTSTGCCG